MKRISSIILMCLLQILTVAASTFTLNVEVTPAGAASPNTSGGTYKEGEEINLWLSTHTGFVFQGWYAEEELVSSATNFRYTMPSHDVTVQARFDYDPAVPANPDQMGTSYTTRLTSRPVGGGSFNTSSVTLEEGKNTRVYAYTNTGYKFLRWEDENGNVLSENREFAYVMPHGGGTLYGVFEFDPAPPANPLKNYWNKELGEVIIDDFTPGNLNSALSSLISGNDRNDVTMITVAGVMTSNDFGIANNYSSCTLLDLSRVTGVTEIPSYAFDNTALETVALPATVERIGTRAFENCKQLAAISIYAMTPPVLEGYAFNGIPDGLVVYVPAAAVAQYQDLEVWKDFTILPIQEDVRNLTISLPSNMSPDPFARMWLEIRNTKNGQRLHYVMTDRPAYTFANIIRNTTWDVTLRNERGDLFGQINNVEVKDDDVAVEFKELSLPQTVTLTVLTPDGEDVSDQIQVGWTDASGNYLGQSNALSGLPTGFEVKYSLTLPQALAMQYALPESGSYTVGATSNNVECKLSPIPQVRLSGKVTDSTTGLPVSGSIITASQTFGGKYNQTVTGKSDRNGEYTITVFNVPTSLTVSASDYVSNTMVCDALMANAEAVTLPQIGLKPISGAVISLAYTYQKSRLEGEEEESQDWYDNYANVAYSIFNKTANRPVTQFNVQYPSIVLLEEVSEGDVLEITATSLSGEFMPVVANVVIDDAQKGDAIFDIIELGGLRATFIKNGNASVSGSLYDATGKLCKTYQYANSALSVNGLKDGKYTLVTMGDSKLFNSIYSLDQLPQTSLSEGNDFVSKEFEVESGRITEITIESVPTLNEAKLYYTGDNTSFTVNKPSIVAGNYLTLTGRIDFKPDYVSEVSNLSLIVDLPKECDFVENSVMVGNNTSSYTMDGNRLTIPVGRITDRVRFCIIPTLGGDYSPSAFAQFTLDGETITQPIGAATYTAKDLSISVPSIVAKTSIPVSGTAIGKSEVEIYDGDMVIGKTTSLANGTWSTECDLGAPYNLSIHDLRAKVTTSSGLVLWTHTESVTYDKEAIEISKVHMYHHNPEMNTTYDVIFDYQNPSPQAQKYIYYIYNKEFSFTIDFTNNDTTKIKDVVLYVQTGDGSWTGLDTEYDKKKDCWYAVGNFGNMYDGNIPKNVGVGYRVIHDIELDTQYIKDYQETRSEEGMKLLNDFTNIDSLYDTLLSLDPQSPSYEENFNKYVNLILQTDNWKDTTPDVDVVLDENIIQKRLDEIRASLAADESFFNNLQDSFNLEKFSEFIYDNYTLIYDDCNNLLPEDLTDYFKFSTVEGHEVYVGVADNNFDYVDFHNNQRIRFIINEEAITRKLTRVSDEGGIKDIKAWIAKLYEIGLQIGQKLKPIEDVITAATAKVTSLGSRLSELNKYAALYKDKGQMASYESVQKEIAKVTKELGKAQKYLTWLKWLQRSLPILNAVQFINQMQADLNALINLYYSVPDPCPNDQAEADEIKRDIIAFGIGAGAYGVGQAALIATSIGALIPAIVAATETMGTSLLVEAALIVAQVASAWAYERTMEYHKEDFQSRIRALKCKKEETPDPIPNPHPGGGTDPGIDPSGFVYEAVTSNRVEGVVATIFYKEMVEDMYGDLHENIVKWDAAEYAQENPLFTDEEGNYRWDVPQGLWQVRFEKDGYETTFSEWLPVPPPQLEVNIPIKQNVQPNVKFARAFEDAVEVEFDKYMQPESLTSENIMVLADDKPIAGNLVLLNEEETFEESGETFASKVRFNANEPFSTKKVTLLVKNRVKSYADIRMQDDYLQSFGVELEIRKIECDSVVDVAYGGSHVMKVSVLPAAAAAEKTLNVFVASAMTISTDKQSVVLDKNGCAEIVINGELPGSGALQFSLEGYDLTEYTIVNVRKDFNKVAIPKISIASGSTVDKGTEVYLTCDTEGATIIYTLDGSCPCDDTDARKEYDGTPIVIEEDVTIKAIAYAPDMYESDIASFVYYVTDAGVDGILLDNQVKLYPLPMREELNISAGDNIIKRVTFTNLSGASTVMDIEPDRTVTIDVSRFPAGVYMITIETERGDIIKKVMKVK